MMARTRVLGFGFGVGERGKAGPAVRDLRSCFHRHEIPSTGPTVPDLRHCFHRREKSRRGTLLGSHVSHVWLTFEPNGTLVRGRKLAPNAITTLPRSASQLPRPSQVAIHFASADSSQKSCDWTSIG